MSRIGTCFRCGAAGVVVEEDHPLGTVAGEHVYPHFTTWLDKPCHRFRSVIDRRVGVEGGDQLSAWLLDRRLAAWDGFLATAGRPILFSPELLAQRTSPP